MIAPAIKALRVGTGTTTKWELVHGKARYTVTGVADGVYVGRDFVSVEDARHFCESELKNDPAATYYALDGDLIVATIYDSAYHEAKKRRATIRYAVVSSLVLAAVATPLFLWLAPFGSLWANAAIAVGIVLFHLAAWSFMGTGNIEGTVLAVLVLILLALLLPSLKRSRDRVREIEPKRTLESPSRSAAIHLPRPQSAAKQVVFSAAGALTGGSAAGGKQ